MRISPATAIAGVLIVALTALALHLMGRVTICECGDVLLWYGRPDGPGNSQHVSDWYSFSHLIHGFIFFGVLWLFRGRLSLGARLLVALGVECSWELIENTPWIIDRYREQTAAADYFGDSVLNSVSDIAFMALGFLLAARLPALVTVAIAVALEIWVGVTIRDNLTLNVIMLLWPLEAIREWQAAG